MAHRSHVPLQLRVLIVEPDPIMIREIERSCAEVAQLTVCPALPKPVRR